MSADAPVAGAPGPPASPADVLLATRGIGIQLHNVSKVYAKASRLSTT